MFGDYSIGDLGSIFAMQGFAGLILFSVYVLMALGLAIIFGQMGVINMAHGEFMILGAYVTWMTSNLFQTYLPGLFSGLLPGLRWRCGDVDPERQSDIGKDEGPEIDRYLPAQHMARCGEAGLESEVLLMNVLFPFEGK